jgi:hypothetical protein
MNGRDGRKIRWRKATQSFRRSIYRPQPASGSANETLHVTGRSLLDASYDSSGWELGRKSRICSSSLPAKRRSRTVFLSSPPRLFGLHRPQADFFCALYLRFNKLVFMNMSLSPAGAGALEIWIAHFINCLGLDLLP